MTTEYVTVEIDTQSCARDRGFNGQMFVRGSNSHWLGRLDNGQGFVHVWNGRWLGRLADGR